jgi:hypothetical protein
MLEMPNTHVILPDTQVIQPVIQSEGYEGEVISVL